jgi:catechol 2,3-dioxygenase-like lactoylglutathione lyase family enzyme
MPRAIDHVVIPARALAAQADLYRRLGFQVGRATAIPEAPKIMSSSSTGRSSM